MMLLLDNFLTRIKDDSSSVICVFVSEVHAIMINLFL
uniref:Uncharacterized protein n=1 Tax=Siphoviridae sp. ctnjE5 TaxID=2826456 RepID=A0A8S5NFD7_9CAUD|nr:MAG TPA: hypothetical protein [Siphoviridae sp. ctnjE5]